MSVSSVSIPRRHGRLRRVLCVAAAVGVVGSLAGATQTASADPSGCTTRVLNVVAHADDDLLFVNPDIANDLAKNRCVRTVVFTAGDAGLGTTYYQGRETGVKAAYALMAGRANSWSSTLVPVGGFTLRRWELLDRPGVELVFLRFPDGGNGDGFPATGNTSLSKLLLGTVSLLSSLDGQITVDKTQMFQLIGAILTEYAPQVVRTHTSTFAQEPRAFDHPDHLSVGQLVGIGDPSYPSPHITFRYTDNPIFLRPRNVTDEEYGRKQGAYFVYSQFDSAGCSIITACTTYADWFQRRYIEGSTYIGAATDFGTRLEAETASTSLTPVALAGATGGVALSPWPVDGYVEFTISAGSPQTVQLRFRHSTSQNNPDVTRTLTVNSGPPQSVVFVPQAPSTPWGLGIIEVRLRAGQNSIRLQRTASDSGPLALDHLVWETVAIGHGRSAAASLPVVPGTRGAAVAGSASGHTRTAAPSAIPLG